MLLCYYAGRTKNGFKQKDRLYAFLSTKDEFSTQTILEYYSQRWPIEVFFRQTKGNLGLNTYQVRSETAIDRFLVLIVLTYLYCVLTQGQYLRFGVGIKHVRKNTERDKIAWVFESAQNEVPLNNIYQHF